MNFFVFPILALAAFTVVGCAGHGSMRGSVAMKTTEREAHVCLGDGSVEVGDRVKAFRSECVSIGGQGERAGGKVNCKMVSIGGGKVVGILNSHYSTVEFDEGVTFAEGTIVQKD